MPDTPAATDTPRTERGRGLLRAMRFHYPDERSDEWRKEILAIEAEAAATPQVEADQFGHFEGEGRDRIFVLATPQVQADPPAEGLRRTSYLHVNDFERLEEWCRLVRVLTHETPYLVGSVNTTPDYRDVDLRVILSDAVFDRWWSDPLRVRYANRALSAWGQRETGLPVDFQIQRQTEANEAFPGFRNPMGLRDWNVQRTSGTPAAPAAKPEASGE